MSPSGRSRQPFHSELLAAARVVARFEQHLRRARRKVADLERLHREAKRNLALLAQAVEPYDPPTTDPLPELDRE